MAVASSRSLPPIRRRASRTLQALVFRAAVARTEYPKRTIAVIGAGVAGIVSASVLARAGHDVTLFEKGDSDGVGGRMHSQTLGGYRFDTGPSLLLFPETYQQTFKQLGAELSDHVDIQKVAEAAYRVHFAHGSHADLLYDERHMCQQLDDMESGAGHAYSKWLVSARAALDVGMKNFIERDFTGWLDFLDPRKLLPLAWQVNLIDMLAPHHWLLSQYFKDERLRALFSLQDLYVGLTPYNAPGVFSLLAATEITDGVWYPVGGFRKVRDALRSVAEDNGVKFVVNCEITQVECEGGRVSAVVSANSSRKPADIVVCNVDVANGLDLVSDARAHARAEKQRNQAYSASVIALNWGVSRPLPKLRHHNVFLSENFRASWDRAVDKGSLQRRPNFYVHAPCKTDPTAAPEGCESIMVLLPVANLQERCAAGLQGHRCMDELIAAGRQVVLNAFEESGIGDIRDDIEQEFVIDPHEWARRYGLVHGAVFGASHSLDQLALFRAPLQDSEIDGLYFAGASARPGNGARF